MLINGIYFRDHGEQSVVKMIMLLSIPEMRSFFFVHENNGMESFQDNSIPSLKRGDQDYQQLPEEPATAWAERFTLHSAGGVSKRAQMNCLYASGVLWPLYLCPLIMSVGDPVTL